MLGRRQAVCQPPRHPRVRRGCASRFWVESERRFIPVCRRRGDSWASGGNRQTSTMRKRVSFQTHSLARRAGMGTSSPDSFRIDNNPLIRFHREWRCTPVCISVSGVHLNYGCVEPGSVVQSSRRDLIAGVKFFALTGPTEISPGQARRRAPPWVRATPRMFALNGLRNADTSRALSAHTHSLNPRSQGGARRASLPWAGFLRPFGANTTTPAIRSGHRI